MRLVRPSIDELRVVPSRRSAGLSIADDAPRDLSRRTPHRRSDASLTDRVLRLPSTVSAPRAEARHAPARVHSRGPEGRASASAHTAPTEVDALIGGSVPLDPSRSVLEVSHLLDGFLRAQGRGLVASRFRSWGSRRFLRRGPDPKTGAPLAFPDTRVHTPRRTPPACSRTASPRPLPSCRSPDATSTQLVRATSLEAVRSLPAPAAPVSRPPPHR